MQKGRWFGVDGRDPCPTTYCLKAPWSRLKAPVPLGTIP